MLRRTLGRSGIEVSALGLGCWAIGGPAWRDDMPIGWSKVDDSESIRAIHRALELGVNFFDTANVYGCGHSEEVLGKALVGRRDQVVIATKFGPVFDADTKQAFGQDASPAGIHLACEASLSRLRTDRIDLYQLHIANLELEPAAVVRDTLEELVSARNIRWYGWSTDNAERARFFADGPHCTAIQQSFNVFGGNAETLAVCETCNLASVVRSPLAMGMLTGKFTHDSKLPADDVRSRWNFATGEQASKLDMLETIRDALTTGGRTLAQGALGWLWARSEQTVPIPGFKTVQQVEENAAAMRFGALESEQMEEIGKATAAES